MLKQEINTRLEDLTMPKIFIKRDGAKYPFEIFKEDVTEIRAKKTEKRKIQLFSALLLVKANDIISMRASLLKVNTIFILSK